MKGNLKEKNNRGFSLLELVVVVAVLAILAVIGGPLFLKIINFARFETAKNHLRESFTSCINQPNISPTNPNIPGVTFQSSNCSSLMSATIDDSCTISMDMATGIKTGWTKSYDACVTPNIAKLDSNSKKANSIKQFPLVFNENVISADLNAPKSVELVDMDNDGDLDFVVVGHPGTTWFENKGSKNFVEHKIEAGAQGGYGVSVADMDGDGDMDIITSGSGLTWLKNDGNYNFEKVDIPTGWEHSWGSGREIALRDMDGDGDMDIIGTKNGASRNNDGSLTSESQVTWYENNGTTNPSFTPNIVDTEAIGAQDVHIEDMDGDGDLDIIVATQDDDSVDWYENNGGSSKSWKKNHISKNVNATNGIFVGDMDGDGDMDILSASQDDQRIAWYENNGKSNPSFQQLNIAQDKRGADDRDPKSVGQAMDVRAADMDGDGDLDVITTNYNGYYHVYNNDGSSNPTFNQNVLAERRGYGVQPYEMDHGDIDGDGDLDIISISNYENKVFWYENK